MDSRLFGIEQELAKVKKTEKQVWTTIASRDERLKATGVTGSRRAVA